MKQLSIIILLFTLLYTQKSEAQKLLFEVPKLRIGVEAGLLTMNGDLVKPSAIRENRSYYYHNFGDDFYSGFINSRNSLTNYYFSIKPEWSVTHRLTLTSGLRLSIINDELNSDQNYFLWQLPTGNSYTNFIRINGVTQKNFSIGIPLELRIYPKQMDCFLRQYFVFGAAFNFNTFSKTTIDFENPAMEKHREDILKTFEKPDVFYSYYYIGIGLKFGKQNHPFGTVELHFPMLIQNNRRITSFFKTHNEVQVGLSTTLYIPVPTKHKLQIIDYNEDYE
ncbi:MAG: hypothetical protein LBT04_05525 [Prevotellaceae bacterium]|jgi:hypothetical protein|nr:hypothetical protein [Prevotellaceae bacterium]